jgi:carboxyl-terminal processing protease
MNRPFRLFGTLLAALLVSVGVGASHAASRPEVPPSVAPEPAGEVSAARAASRARAAKKSNADYPLRDVPVASQVIITLKDQYLDRSRFKPKEMLVTALRAVERKVAEVMVQGDAQSQKLTLTVGQAQRELDISGVTSIWTIKETSRTCGRSSTKR